MKFLWELGILLLLPISTLQRSSPSSLSYVGAVVEYSPIVSEKDGKSVPDLNADNYLKFIDTASQYAVDIIVFPESSLSVSSAAYIPDPEDDIILCDDTSNTYTYALKSISCAAQAHGMYVVINHREKVKCTGANCPSNRLLLYNSNVVFDRNGKIIAKYRKYNLFGEKGLNTTSVPMVSTFKTDFGVTFGQFICFDLLFETPTLNLTRNLGITDIVFSTHWFSELPHLFSVEAQAAWAYANDVNFLASGYNNPKTASIGSGIYIGRKGYAHVVMEKNASNILTISEIPKVIKGKRALNIDNNMIQVYKFSKTEIPTSNSIITDDYSYRIDNLAPYTKELIDLKIESHNKIVCNNDLCCEFNLKINFNESVITDNATYYRYRFSVFNGVRTFSHVTTGGVKICGIISCTSDKKEDCGKLFASTEKIVMPTTFKSIEISLKNIDDERSFFMPTTLSTNMLPLNATEFSYQSINVLEKVNIHHMDLKKPRNDLMTFAIFGRNFVMDGAQESSASSIHFMYSSIIFSTFWFIIFLYSIATC